jgi:hypothetical protein
MSHSIIIKSLLAVFITAAFLAGPVLADPYNISITEDYRYQNWYSSDENIDKIALHDKEAKISEDGQFTPISAVFDAFGWLAESIGSLFGADAPDPYQANPAP